MELKEIKQLCIHTIDQEFEGLWDLATYLFDNPEVAFKEKKACAALCKALDKHGFVVDKNIGKLPTAFRARFKKGSGPHIAVFAEYDALAQIGHACGHHLIATSALGCAYAVKKALEESDLEGTIEVYGTPAEEDGGGKIIMLEHGEFEDVDAVFLMHPTSAMTRIGGVCASFCDLSITYEGKSAHAQSHPENGINALDAATLFYQAVGLLRQQLRDDVHICCIISKTNTDLGRISDYAKVEVEISTMIASEISMIKTKIQNIAQGMALATGCQVCVNDIGGYLGRTPNAVLANLCRKELLALQEDVMEGMPSDAGGEDLGNVSRVIPACNVYGTILPEKKISGHTEQFRDLSISENGKHCLDVTSKAMANAIIELFRNTKSIEEAKNELKQRIEEEEKMYGK